MILAAWMRIRQVFPPTTLHPLGRMLGAVVLSRTALSQPEAEEHAMSDQLRLIPLSALKSSAANVRRTDAKAELEALAASIEAHGLLQNLTVEPGPSGTFHVVAGGRRLAALKLLAKRKRLAKDVPVPCKVIDGGATASELSLAENVVRIPLHPADQFTAFSALQVDGLGAEEIAARFGVSPVVVRQRLKLAAVSPRLMEVYRQGGMDLDQLMAFAISDDHAAQERVWFEALNGGTVPVSDPQGPHRLACPGR